VKEEVRNAGEQAHRADALLFGLFQQRGGSCRPRPGPWPPASPRSTAPQPDVAHTDAAHRSRGKPPPPTPIPRSRARSRRSPRSSAAAACRRGERVDQLEDVHRILQPRLAHHRATHTGASRRWNHSRSSKSNWTRAQTPLYIFSDLRQLGSHLTA
jgi:hypothetical protein